jgi:hypothetical protein
MAARSIFQLVSAAIFDRKSPANVYPGGLPINLRFAAMATAFNE